MEASVEPLSATITSPESPALRNASIALSTQYASEFASFKQGMTTDTSTGCVALAESGKAPSEASVVFIRELIITRSLQLFITRLRLTGKASKNAKAFRWQWGSFRYARYTARKLSATFMTKRHADSRQPPVST